MKFTEEDALPYLRSAQSRLDKLGLRTVIMNCRLVASFLNGYSYEYEVRPQHSWSLAQNFLLVKGEEEIPALCRDEDEPEVVQYSTFDPSQDPIQVSYPAVPGIRYFSDMIRGKEPYLPALEEMKRLQP